ncbi:hypothetical protein Tco_1047739 [Tanacetum coccineum]
MSYYEGKLVLGLKFEALACFVLVVAVMIGFLHVFYAFLPGVIPSIGTHRGIHTGWQNSIARIVAAQLEHQASMNLKNYCCLVLHLD